MLSTRAKNHTHTVTSTNHYGSRGQVCSQDEEVNLLQQKGTVIPVQTGQERVGFCSTRLLVQKSEQGQMRPVVNLRPLNTFLPHVHFKREGLHISGISFGDRTGCAESISRTHILQSPCAYIKSSFGKGELTNLLVFHLVCTRVFTKVLHSIVGWLCLRGVRCVIYFNNFLIMVDTTERASEQCIAAICVLELLGFLVSSQVKPVQVLTFLGLVVDSTEKLEPSFQKLSKIKSQVRDLLEQDSVYARMLAQFLGKLSATYHAVQPAVQPALQKATRSQTPCTEAGQEL